MIGSNSNRHNQGRWLLILAGTLTLALAGCEGPAGPAGDDGQNGLPGQNGNPGQDGTDGTDGTDGEDGNDGEDGEDGEQGPQGPAGPSTWLSAPGVNLAITDAELTAERKLAITWTIVDQKDQPLDRAGRVTEGAYAPTFVVAYLDPVTNQFVSLKTRTETAGEVTTVQATGDSGGTTTDVTLGTYRYTTALTVPETLPANTTVRVHGYASRTYQGIAYVGADAFDFTLDGSAPAVRQIVTDAACDACHGGLTAHGRRRGVDGCVTCHTFQSTDAQTGNTVDMATMVHKIHTGVNLPSVKNGEVGTFYGISGHQNHLYTYAEKTADGVVGVQYLRDMRSCDVCHGGAAQGEKKFTTISTASCTTCHDNVSFVSPAPAGKVMHTAGAKSDATCAGCHEVGGFSAVDLAHRTDLEWAQDEGLAKGLVVEIVSVTGVAAGGRPTVNFTLKDGTGANVAPASMASLNAVFGGPMPTPEWTLSGQNLKTATDADADGVYTLQVAGTLPATLAAGDTVLVTIDSRFYHQADRDGDGVNSSITEAPYTGIAYVVAGTDAVGAARAFDVPTASCERCHGKLANHGGQRNTMESCVNCHTPSLTDAARRNDGTTPVSVDMPVMIHKIHAGEHLSQGYEVFGYGNVKHDFGHIVFTSQLNDCQTCHTGGAWKNPSTRTCITCHDSPAAAAHAELNTTAGGVEACEVCHGAGSTLGADKVHTPVP